LGGTCRLFCVRCFVLQIARKSFNQSINLSFQIPVALAQIELLFICVKVMPMPFVFPAPPQASLSIAGNGLRYPVRRIFCVGRNYAAHSVEMGGDPTREEPFFFTKPAHAVWQGDGDIPFPPQTNELHHEMELVVALGKPGSNITVENALDHVWGYGAGIDLTRRDLQATAKQQRRPWDLSKGFDHSAPISALMAASQIGHPQSGQVSLSVNGDVRQKGDLDQQIWKVAEVIANLSTYVELQPGDLIMTGTPAGVAELHPGDRVEGIIDGIGKIEFTLGAKPEASS